MAILFIGPTRIGDAVLSTGLLDHLIGTERGGDDITVACGALPAPLFAAAPGVGRVIAIAKRSYGRHWASVWAETVGRRWDLIVDLRNSIIPRTVRAGRRAILPRHRDGEHRIVQIARTLDLGDTPPAPRLWATAEQAAAATRLVAAGPVLALGPTANWRGKIWRTENFTALVDLLTGAKGVLSGARVAVFGAAGERDIAAPLMRAVPDDRLIDLVGKVDLPTSYACLTRCDLFIGHDSGLMHMAAAAGIPTLGLFGPSKPERYAPWGSQAAYVRTALEYDELVGGPGYDPHDVGTLMDSLAVDDVARAAADLMRGVEAARA